MSRQNPYQHTRLVLDVATLQQDQRKISRAAPRTILLTDSSDRIDLGKVKLDPQTTLLLPYTTGEISSSRSRFGALSARQAKDIYISGNPAIQTIKAPAATYVHACNNRNLTTVLGETFVTCASCPPALHFSMPEN